MIDNELVKWLDTHINYETDKLSRRATMPTLERIELLLKYLGDPQENLKSIHITGTNGKTSTARITDALLQAKGLRVGAITSPHLFEINERLLLDSKPVDSAILNSALWILKNTEENISEIAQKSPSWFELMIAGSFYILNDEAVDVSVVEVGMGGQFDATNVIHSDVSVITNVELDHMQYLGNTRAEIAKEKSGIIKENAITVIGETEESLVTIIENKCNEVSAKPLLLHRDFDIYQNDQAVGGRLLSFATPYGRYDEVFLPLFGMHQGINAVIAATAAECFIDSYLGEEVLSQGFSDVKNPGRLEIINRDPLILIDGAHNVAGAQTLARALEEEFYSDSRIYILGLTQEKDPEAFLNALNVDNQDIVIAAQADSPRAMQADKIATAAKSMGIENVITSTEIRDAIVNAMNLALDDSQIIITGSLYLVGQSKNLINQL